LIHLTQLCESNDNSHKREYIDNLQLRVSIDNLQIKVCIDHLEISVMKGTINKPRSMNTYIHCLDNRNTINAQFIIFIHIIYIYSYVTKLSLSVELYNQ
jgi:hypothetical protein